jgi:DNA-binding transcriptional ArsR family regulator
MGPIVEEPSVVTAIDSLRVIAHPARIRIYEVLVLDGPQTVSALAERAELAVGSASYHLKQLHRAGFVEESRGENPDRRNHWWRAVPGGLKWEPTDYLGSVSGTEISTSAQRMMAERRIRRLGRWTETWHLWDRDWIEASVETDTFLELTSEELAELGQEVSAVIRRWSKRSGTQGSSSASERSPVFLFFSAFPIEKGS